jgi:cell division septum initiation protein DivIVA
MRDSVLDLLVRLEALVRQAPLHPRTAQRLVDERELSGLLQMIRGALPEELRAAQRLRAEAERALRGAQDEARALVLEAQATARRLVDEHAVAREAERQRDDLLARAAQEARRVRQDADAYAARVLADLEARLERILETVRRGRESLKDAAPSAYNEQSGSGQGKRRAGERS